MVSNRRVTAWAPDNVAVARTTAPRRSAGYEIDGSTTIELVIIGTLGYAWLHASLLAVTTTTTSNLGIRNRLHIVANLEVGLTGIGLDDGDALLTFFDDGGGKDETGKNGERKKDAGKTHDVMCCVERKDCR